MKLIVGLGNPDAKYAMTRHNAGFWVVDKLATIYGATFAKSSNQHAETAKTSIQGVPVLLAKPSTYMNLSGRAVQAILHWYKMSVDDCLVIHDDVSLPLGRLRFQQGGGAGGQHGVESIIEMLGGNKSFHRLKYGVGPDPGGDRRADYVLSGVPESDREMRDKIIDIAGDGVVLWLREGMLNTANKFNGTDLRPKPAPLVKPPPSKDETGTASKTVGGNQEQDAAKSATILNPDFQIFSDSAEKPVLKPFPAGADAATANTTLPSVTVDTQLQDVTIVDCGTTDPEEDLDLDAPPPPF